MSYKVKKMLQHMFVTSVAGVSLLAPAVLSTGGLAQASRIPKSSVTRVKKSRRKNKKHSKRRNNTMAVHDWLGNPSKSQIKRASRAATDSNSSSSASHIVDALQLGAATGTKSKKAKPAKRAKAKIKGKVYWRGHNKMIGNKIIVHAHHKTYLVPASAEGVYGKTNVHEFLKWRHIISPNIHFRTPSNVPFLPYIFGDKHARGGEFRRAETSKYVWNKYYANLSFKDFVGKINIIVGETGGQWSINRAGRFQMIAIPRRDVGSNQAHQVREEKYALHYLAAKHIPNWATAGYMECHAGY